MPKKSIAEKISAVQARLERLREKHAQWHPADSASMKTWEKQLATMKHKAEFSEQPTIKEFIDYVQRSNAEIREVLLRDKKLSESDRRLLMEKRDFMTAWLKIFVPSKLAVDALEVEINFQLREDRKPPLSDFSH